MTQATHHNQNSSVLIATRIFVVLTLTTIALSGCSWMKSFTGPEKEEKATDATGGGDAEGVAGSSKNASEPGMVQIKRRAAGYEISMVLDASDENVYFVMDLPEEGSTEIESEKDKKPRHDKQKKLEAQEPASRESPQSLATRHVVNAQTLFFEKRYERALDEVGKSLDLVPDSPTAYSLKGSIHYKLGEKRLARESWEKALEIDPQMDDVKAMLKKVN